MKRAPRVPNPQLPKYHHPPLRATKHEKRRKRQRELARRILHPDVDEVETLELATRLARSILKEPVDYGTDL